MRKKLVDPNSCEKIPDIKKKDFMLHLFYVSIVIQVWSNKIEHKTKPNFFVHIHEHTFSLVMDFSCAVYI